MSLSFFHLKKSQYLRILILNIVMDIITATTNDIETIQNIALPTWKATYSEILSSEQMEYMLEMMYSNESLTAQLSDNNQTFLLACEDNKKLGFVSFEVVGNEDKVKLHKLYVLPDQQGKRIGETLIKEVEKRAAAAKKIAVQLNVNRFNKALNFYKRVGFEIIEEVDVEIGNGYLMEDYVLEKRV